MAPLALPGARQPSSFRSVTSVTIDRSGRWWTGSEPGDIEEYLADLTAGQVDAAVTFSRSQCRNCGSEVFALRYNASEGWAERRCTACRSTRRMLDSADLVDEVKPTNARCRCGGKSFNLAVGFALRGDVDVRWVYLGLPCTRDGVLGCCADWKIAYSPSSALFQLV